MPSRNDKAVIITDEALAGTRVIFTDTERSNWTWDPVAKQYFWHRFFSHQPDLNFDNPAVREAMMEALRFWLDLGVDGFRLDAVPYLYEREGTNCENLEQTHQVLKQLRSRIDAKYTGRMLLAEANQWPRDEVEYFGDGAHYAAPDDPASIRAAVLAALEDVDELLEVGVLDALPQLVEGLELAQVLRELVVELGDLAHLDTVDLVDTYGDEHVDLGGAGITIVILDV